MTGIYDSCNGWRNWATRGIGEAFKDDEGFTAPAWKWWCAGNGMSRKEAEEYIANQIEKWVNEQYDRIYRWADWRFREAITPPSMMDIDYHAIARAVMDDYEVILSKSGTGKNGSAGPVSSENKKAVPKKRSDKKGKASGSNKSRPRPNGRSSK